MRARRAEPRDLDAVCAIEGAYATTAHWSRHQISEELSAPASVFLVAEISEGIAGFLIARRYPPRLEILDIAVGVQRRGVGSFLLDALKAETSGCDTITLEVSSNNAGGQAFYGALGFKIVGRRPRFYHDGSDAVLMDLALDPGARH